MSPRSRALGIAIGYAALAGLYALASSTVLGSFELDAATLATVEILAELGFVAVTAAVLFVLAHRPLRELVRTQRELSTRTAELARAKQHASIATLASAVAHETNNLLTVAQTARDDLATNGSADHPALQDLDHTHDRLKQLARDLMQRVKGGAAPRIERIDVAELARESARLATLVARARNCTVDVEVSGTPTLLADRRELEYVLENLLHNAIEANRGRGRVAVSITSREDSMAVRIEDEGPGISAELRDRIFEPFFTTKGDGGTGLGLAVARDVVRSYGGDIYVQDGSPRGTCFTVELRDRDTEESVSEPSRVPSRREPVQAEARRSQ